MKRMQFIANLAAAMALLASTAVLDAEPILYSTTGGGSTLVRIDVGAGTVTTIGDLGVPGAALALAISPKGKLYTVTQGWPPEEAVNPQLARVDVATGLATPFGVNLNPEIFMGIGFSPKGKVLRSECGQRDTEPEQPLPVQFENRQGQEGGRHGRLRRHHGPGLASRRHDVWSRLGLALPHQPPHRPG